MLPFAIRITREAGNILKTFFNQKLEVQYKSNERDLVTQADIAAETYLINTIRETYPSHGILAEESGNLKQSDYQWIIDPLDGTTNFAHGYPIFCVTIALAHCNQIILGVTYDPLREELFTAEKDTGAQLNGHSIHVSQQNTLSHVILATGFPYNRATNPNNNLREFCKLMPRIRGIRRSGSAALDLAYVASGRLDGYWEYNLNAWDMAAGVLLVQEAGGLITSCDQASWQLGDTSIVAANPSIHNMLLDALQQPEGNGLLS